MKLDPSRDPSRPFFVAPDGKWDGPAVGAIKALAKGQARPDQQITAMNFIIEEICRTYDLPYRPDELGGERDSSFAAGKQFVGFQLRRIIAQPFEKLVGKKSTGENP